MKKLLLLLSFIPILFISCASLSNENEEFIPEFETSYDRASGITSTREYNLTKHYMPNIATSLYGENEWVTMSISEKDDLTVLYLGWIYQATDWLFVNTIEFYNDSGTRLYFKDESPSREVISGKNVIEYMNYFPTQEEIETLYNLAHEDTLYCVFIGSRLKTRELIIKPKIKKSIIATIDKYNEIRESK